VKKNHFNFFAVLCGLILTAALNQQLFAQAATEAAGAARVGAAASGAAQVPGVPTVPGAPTIPGTPVAQSQGSDTINDLTVGVGKTILVDTAQPIARISIGIGDIAVASAVNRTEVMVNGKTAGETSLIIWDNQGNRQFFNVSVRANTAAIVDQLESIRRELRTELPQQNVSISLSNGMVFLRGTVDNLGNANRAVMIASTVGKVVNLLDVKVPQSDPQILLKVRFVSVDRSLGKQLGINFYSLGLGNAVGAITTGQFSPPIISAGGGGSGSGGSGGSGGSSGGISSGTASATLSNDLNILAFFPGLKAGTTIAALQNEGLVQLLAEPNLLAANGKQASFLAGGQYPYPVVQGSAGTAPTVTIQFKDYGIRLNFIPTITPRGTIRLQVAPEVSALDYANSVTISGFTVPGITTRKVNTEVELGERQSFVLGGLLDNSISQTFQKIPFVGDIPVIGKLFQSINRTKNNSELIVIVTPEIVAPIPAAQPLPALNFPQPFLAPNSNIPMHTPDAAGAAAPPAPATMPVEQLIQSMKPETQLTGTEGTSGGYVSAPAMAGGASAAGASTGASSPGAP
jgi:pilus assembly protein CpaC